MADGAAFHGDLEMEQCAERDFPVAGEANPGASACGMAIGIFSLSVSGTIKTKK